MSQLLNFSLSFGFLYPHVTFCLLSWLSIYILYHFYSFPRATEQNLECLLPEFPKKFTLSYINQEQIPDFKGSNTTEFRIWPWTEYLLCFIKQCLLQHLLLLSHLSISKDIAGVWENTSKTQRRGLRYWFFSVFLYHMTETQIRR